MKFAKKVEMLCLVATMVVTTNALAQVASRSIAPLPTRMLPLPTGPSQQISLDCDTTYYGGVLELSNTSKVTVETKNFGPGCGRAVITPAAPVAGWRVYQGNIYVADAPQEVTQVFANGQILGVAHHPNSQSETGWIMPTNVEKIDPKTNQVTSEGGVVFNYNVSVNASDLPSQDLVGAKVTYRGRYPYTIGTRVVQSYNGGVMTLPLSTSPDLVAEDAEFGIKSGKNPALYFGRFYLEGKLWMLDSPGEWVWSQNKLYVWMPDGQAPGNRILATPKNNYAVNAAGSTLLEIKNVRIFGGRIGIAAGYSNDTQRGSDHLQVTNTEIAYSDWVGIYASEAKNMAVDGSEIYGALHTGIYARTQATPYTGSLAKRGTIIRNSRFTNIDSIGMHKGSDGSIFLNHETGAQVINNTITNSGKSGIFMGLSVSSLTKNNLVDGACRIHGDCGGIYVLSSETAPFPLNSRIDGNTVKNVTGEPEEIGSTDPRRFGIYLDNYSNGVAVVGNTITNNDSGMMLHLAFNNQISSNVFSNSQQRHVVLADSGGNKGSMRNNVFTNNAYYGNKLIYLLAVTNPKQAAVFQKNNYTNVTAGQLVDPADVDIVGR
jgi:parallel beta-helix repeat protein